MASDLVKKAERQEGGDFGRFLEDLASLKGDLAQIISAAGPEGFDEGKVWSLYARTEKLVAVLKFRLGYETPATFAKLPRAREPKALLEEAERLLSVSRDEISGGRMTEAVDAIRRARNNLRACLADRRRSLLKGEREARRKKVSKIP